MFRLLFMSVSVRNHIVFAQDLSLVAYPVIQLLIRCEQQYATCVLPPKIYTWNPLIVCLDNCRMHLIYLQIDHMVSHTNP